MKLSKIFISQDLVPSSNPAPYPVEPQCEVSKWDELSKIDAPNCRESVNCPCHQHQQAVEQWHQGALGFEDHNRLLVKLAFQGVTEHDYKPNTLIPVKLEAEIITQQHILTQDIKMIWRNVPKEWPLSPHNKGVNPSIFRVVLRLVDKKQ